MYYLIQMSKIVEAIVDKYSLNPQIKFHIIQYINEYLHYYNTNDLNTFYSNNARKIDWNSLSFKTNFIFNEIMCNLMNKLVGKYTFTNDSCIDFNMENDNILQKLNNDGYCIGHIDKSMCDSILDSMKNISFKERSTGRIVSYNSTINYQDNCAWAKSQEEVINIPAVQNLICDHKLLNIVQNYLNAKPILTQTNLWFTKNINNNNKVDNAQLFHRDFDHERWIKIFIYIKDVNIVNGPHVFVKKSHTNVGTVGRGAFVRESDETIKKNYPCDDIVTHTGKSGTIIFEDTRGYHKGLPVVEGERVLLQLEFAINPSYGNTHIKKVNNPIKLLKEAKQKYPYVFQNIRI